MRDVLDDWRKSSVSPVFKRGKKEDPGSCRLVSFTSISGKVTEQLFLEVISKYMEEKVPGGVSMDSPRVNHA